MTSFLLPCLLLLLPLLPFSLLLPLPLLLLLLLLLPLPPSLVLAVSEVISAWGWQQDGEMVLIQNQEEHIKPKKILAKIELDSKLPY